jgi:CLIP-associating protein 1/2
VDCLASLHQGAPEAVAAAIASAGLSSERLRELQKRMPSSGEVPSAGTTVATGPAGRRSGSGGGIGALDCSAREQPSASGRGNGSGAVMGPTAAPLGSQSPASSRAAQAGGAAVGPGRRGGFRDGGGMLPADADLPPAEPIPVTSERDLRSDLEAATATLAEAPSADWQVGGAVGALSWHTPSRRCALSPNHIPGHTRFHVTFNLTFHPDRLSACCCVQGRMAAMQRVEGLVLGGAAEWDAFHECLKPLAQALTQQFKERRSTIARQTCHLIGGAVARHAHLLLCQAAAQGGLCSGHMCAGCRTPPDAITSNHCIQLCPGVVNNTKSRPSPVSQCRCRCCCRRAGA